MRNTTRPITYEEWLEHDSMLNAPSLLDPKHEPLLDSIRRVSGDAICPQCGKDYYSHPKVVGALWATQICDGSLVKL